MPASAEQRRIIRHGSGLSGPSFPAFFEQFDAAAGAGVGAADLVIQADAEPRPIR
jgi:hypothetical protein